MCFLFDFTSFLHPFYRFLIRVSGRNGQGQRGAQSVLNGFVINGKSAEISMMDWNSA